MVGMKKILLTGGNGYVGSRLLMHLEVELNSAVVDSVDMCLFGMDLGRSRRMDYREIDDLSEYDAVIHLAGHSSIGMCSADRKGSWRNNVEGFRRLCDIMKKGQRLIFASSASVYPAGTMDAEEEACIGTPVRQEYDMQKMCVELIGKRMIQEGKMAFGLRMGTVNGASPNTRSDLMMNAMVKSGMERGIITASGVSVRRSILGINDFCRAVVRMLTSEEPEPGMYNLASFHGTVGEFSNLCASATGASVEHVDGDGGGFDFTLSTRKFRENFEFDFLETAEDVIYSLVSGHPRASYDERKTCHEGML